MKPNKTVKFLLILIFVYSCVLTGSVPASQRIASLTTKGQFSGKLETAKDVFFTYHKDIKNLDKSIDILQNVLKNDPGNLEALLLLSRAWLTYGYVRTSSDEEKIAAYKHGMGIAKRAIKISPRSPNAHFYYAANMAALGKKQGVLKSLYRLRELRKELDTILTLDPEHAKGLALNGILYYTLPGFLGGDLDISEMYLRRAIRLEPNETVFKIYLAKNLSKQKRYDESRQVLREVIEEKNPAVYADWYFNKEKAKRMIADLNEDQEKQEVPYSLN
jgi:tetratricopeptide (TPR) repeat protein